jgi:hypothetical protein
MSDVKAAIYYCQVMRRTVAHVVYWPDARTETTLVYVFNADNCGFYSKVNEVDTFTRLTIEDGRKRFWESALAAVLS